MPCRAYVGFSVRIITKVCGVLRDKAKPSSLESYTFFEKTPGVLIDLSRYRAYDHGIASGHASGITNQELSLDRPTML